MYAELTAGIRLFLEKREKHTLPEVIDMREESEERTSGRILVRGMLGYISGGTLLGMILYETAKEFLLPSLSKWESHLITIVVTVLLVTLLTAYALRMQNNLRSEISRNRHLPISALERRSIWRGIR